MHIGTATRRAEGDPAVASAREQATVSERAAVSRRSFLAGGVAAGVGVGLGPLGRAATALGAPASATGALSAGDAAMLRFLAAAEILETDPWQQYDELGGVQDAEVPGGTGSPR